MEPIAPVTLTGRIDFGTHYRASQAAARRNKWFVVLTYAFFVGLPALTLLLLLAKGSDIHREGAFGLPVWASLLLGPLFIFVIVPLLRLLKIWQARNRNTALQGELKATFSTEGFQFSGASFEIKLRWDAIHRVVETSRFFMVYISTSQAHITPKHWATSPAQIHEIRALLLQVIGSKANLRSD